MPTYAQNKPHIYKWRETHRESYNEYHLAINRKYQEDNKELITARRRRAYFLKKPDSHLFVEEVQRLSNISIS